MDITKSSRAAPAESPNLAAAFARRSSRTPAVLRNVLNLIGGGRSGALGDGRALPPSDGNTGGQRAHLVQALRRITLQLERALQENAAAKRHRFRLLRALLAAETRAKAGEYRADHDELTALPNRPALTRRLPSLLSEAFGAQRPIVLLFIDIDAFKDVNDRLGHAAGDRLLVLLARRLRGFLRSGDAAFRFGGDEFVVLLSSDRDIERAEETLERIRSRLERPYLIAGVGHRITASIGIARWPSDATAAKALLHAADLSMYRDKVSRRNLPCP